MANPTQLTPQEKEKSIIDDFFKVLKELKNHYYYLHVDEEIQVIKKHLLLQQIGSRKDFVIYKFDYNGDTCYILENDTGLDAIVTCNKVAVAAVEDNFTYFRQVVDFFFLNYGRLSFIPSYLLKW